MPQIGDLDSCRALPLFPRAALDASFVANADAPEWAWLPEARDFVATGPAEGCGIGRPRAELRDPGLALELFLSDDQAGGLEQFICHVRVRLEPNRFILEIEDDGRGVAEADKAKGRNGLRNMRKRMSS